MYYAARVELHEPFTDADYVALHKALVIVGFFRAIKASDNNTYYLPPGTYYCIGTHASLAAATLALKTATLAVHANSSLVVFETTGGWSSHNLKIVVT